VRKNWPRVSAQTIGMTDQPGAPVIDHYGSVAHVSPNFTRVLGCEIWPKYGLDAAVSKRSYECTI